MSFIHDFLGLKRDSKSATQDPRAIAAIRTRLADIPETEARLLAAFSYVLARVAYADLQVDEQETTAMTQLVSDHMALGADQASLVVEMATTQASALGGTQDFVVTKLLGELASPELKAKILECLLSVAAADDIIVGQEEKEMRLIARQLGISDKDFLAALSRYRDKRSVLKDWPS